MTNMLTNSRGLIKSVWKEYAATGELRATLHVPTLSPKASLSSGHGSTSQTSGQLLCGIGTRKQAEATFRVMPRLGCGVDGCSISLPEFKFIKKMDVWVTFRYLENIQISHACCISCDGSWGGKEFPKQVS